MVQEPAGRRDRFTAPGALAALGRPSALTDPAHGHLNIAAIAARWGFTSHARFTRTCTTDYGTTPNTGPAAPP